MTGRAMSAGTAETRSGSGRKPASAVANGDGPQTTDNRENIVTTSEQKAVPAPAKHLCDIMTERMRTGWHDDSEAVQAFARHRLAATSLHDMQITPAPSLPCKSGEGESAAGNDSVQKPQASRNDATQTQEASASSATGGQASTDVATQTREAEGENGYGCLLEDLHNALHRGEKCPECGHDPYAARTGASA